MKKLNNHILYDKASLRLDLKKKRNLLNNKVSLSIEIIEKLKTIIEVPTYKSIAIYYPMPSEVNIWPLSQYIIGNKKNKKKCYLPKLIGNTEMFFYQYDKNSLLKKIN